VYDSLHAKFLAAWADNSSTIGIFSQVINADGSLTSARTLLSNALYLYWNDDGPVSGAFDADTGQFLVVMRDWQNLSAQAVSSDGTPTGAATAISSSDDFEDRAVTVYDNVNKRYIVSWSDHDRLRGQFLNPDASLQGASFSMSGAVTWLRHHALAFDAPDQRYIEVYDSIKWEDDQVYGQMLNADGTLTTSAAGSQFLISPNDYPGARRPSVVFNSTEKKFLVIWKFEGDDARFPDIHGQIINPDGTMDSGIFVAAVGAP
jgi:hypothetical protein